MSKLEKFKKLIKDNRDNFSITDVCYDHALEGTRIFIYPMNGCFGYMYRQLAYYSSTWEDVYITGISVGYSITMFFEGEVFDL